jgi:GNAT superfamily N-acetyltransferase
MEVYSHKLGVFVRPAILSDAEQLIEMNSQFWSVCIQCTSNKLHHVCVPRPTRGRRRPVSTLDSESLLEPSTRLWFLRDGCVLFLQVLPLMADPPPHPTRPHRSDVVSFGSGVKSQRPNDDLNLTDVRKILSPNDESRMMVLCRHVEGGEPDNTETTIGYSFSFAEHMTSSTGKVVPPATKKSLYVAELYIKQEYRGCGLGELLLANTLLVDSAEPSCSHLYVSKRNDGAVRCYRKFGYRVVSNPSGDAEGDVIMELESRKVSVVEANLRFSQKLEGDIVRARQLPSSTSACDISAHPHSQPASHNGSPCTMDSGQFNVSDWEEKMLAEARESKNDDHHSGQPEQAGDPHEQEDRVYWTLLFPESEDGNVSMAHPPTTSTPACDLSSCHPQSRQSIILSSPESERREPEQEKVAEVGRDLEEVNTEGGGGENAGGGSKSAGCQGSEDRHGSGGKSAGGGDPACNRLKGNLEKVLEIRELLELHMALKRGDRKREQEGSPVRSLHFPSSQRSAPPEEEAGSKRRKEAQFEASTSRPRNFVRRRHPPKKKRNVSWAKSLWASSSRIIAEGKRTGLFSCN